MKNVGQSTDRREVFRCRAQHLLELLLRGLVLAQLHERAPKRDARGRVGRVSPKARAADVHRLLKHSRAAVLFSELGKRNRRRVLLDPSSEIFET